MDNSSGIIYFVAIFTLISLLGLFVISYLQEKDKK